MTNRAFRLAAATCVALLASTAMGQAPERLRGSLVGTFSNGDTLRVSLTCERGSGAAGSCAGNYNARFDEPKCVNSMYVLNAVSLTGLDLSRPGPIQGLAALSNFYIEDKSAPDGTCVLSPEDYPPFNSTYTGTWDGSVASISFPPIVDRKGRVLQLGGTLQPELAPPPALPASISGRIDASVVNAAAAIQYRPEDLGKTASVFTFALAPENLVVKATSGDAPFVLGKSRPSNGNKDTPVACVLAQLNTFGQLQAVSFSSLQAYVSGVLSSAGQAVQVINGVATASIGGATFYVGYGTSATAMIGSGINRSVVTVPGGQVCQPQPPQTGWWWNAAEDGRGYTIESTGNKLFFAAYLYDVSGRSTWYVSAGPTSLDGSLYVGDLESYGGGQTLTGAFRSPRRPGVLNGQLALAFNDPYHGTLSWPGGTVAISRMEFGEGGVNAVPQANQPENGWWFSGQDDGRGFFIEWQAGVAFMAGFMYDDGGNPVWYVAAEPRHDNPQAFSGNWLQFVNGQTLTGAYRPPERPGTLAGPATIQFQGAADAIMTMPGGRQVTLLRYRF